MLIDINEKIFRTKVVFSETDIQQGMMNKVFDETFNGMFFMVNDGEHCFWMKNCIIPLDIIFIQDDEIVNIYHNCYPCINDDCKNYCSYGNYVLEIDGGSCKRFGINVGDLVKYI